MTSRLICLLATALTALVIFIACNGCQTSRQTDLPILEYEQIPDGQFKEWPKDDAQRYKANTNAYTRLGMVQTNINGVEIWYNPKFYGY